MPSKDFHHEGPHPKNRIFVPGQSCWKRAHADRLAFLVDGSEYFPALESALRKARRQILIIAWDFFSQLKLVGPEDELAQHLGIKYLLNERPALEVHLVLFDPALIYVPEREFFPTIKLGTQTHPRFHFHLDVNFPSGASQHQKFVVIDDAVCFIGGIDLTSRRWDTSAHAPGDPGRMESDGTEYRPFLDMQVLLDGEVARDLGDLARERILVAKGERVKPPSIPSDPWPTGVQPDLEDIHIAIARTQADWNEVKPRQDTLEAYRRIIQRARRFIYIEN